MDGRPISRSSSSRTRVASVYRAGGLVLCPSAVTSTGDSVSPLSTSGSGRSSESVSPSSTLSTYAFKKPWKVITLPVAVNSPASPLLAVASTRIVTLRPSASRIWDATVRIQISS